MALRGNAFIIMWHDIAPEAEADYHQWHTHQHMPERLGHSGFLRSRRGVNWGHDHQRYFTLYEGESLETFLHQDYALSLNNPTDWTQAVAPHFRNFRRMACAVRRTSGTGVGGALATFRIALLPDMAHEAAIARLDALLPGLEARTSVTAVHLAEAVPDISERRTRETELRPAMAEPMFDLVLIVEGMGLDELSADLAAMASEVEALGLGTVTAQAYDMAYLLAREDA
jgi:hypothetical protein